MQVPYLPSRISRLTYFPNDPEFPMEQPSRGSRLRRNNRTCIYICLGFAVAIALMGLLIAGVFYYMAAQDEKPSPTNSTLPQQTTAGNPLIPQPISRRGLIVPLVDVADVNVLTPNADMFDAILPSETYAHLCDPLLPQSPGPVIDPTLFSESEKTETVKENAHADSSPQATSSTIVPDTHSTDASSDDILDPHSFIIPEPNASHDAPAPDHGPTEPFIDHDATLPDTRSTHPIITDNMVQQANAKKHQHSTRPIITDNMHQQLNAMFYKQSTRPIITDNMHQQSNADMHKQPTRPIITDNMQQQATASTVKSYPCDPALFKQQYGTVIESWLLKECEAQKTLCKAQANEAKTVKVGRCAREERADSTWTFDCAKEEFVRV